ncbi:MAG: DUF427 domain-containing protein [Mycolicibacterium sp.]|nr:DUF427 domain-containing protein [Mycolicibacterium sp.]
MSTRPVKEPTAEHPITVEPTAGRVRVRVNGEVVADTHAALGLREATYPVVQYIPLRDVDARVLTRSDTHTYCPYKGEAGYYNVTAAGATVADAIWTYEQPYPAVAAIAGHVAFYPDKSDITVEPA